VIEGFVELGIPLINTPAWGNATLQIAGRHARYSTAGDSNTWKAGVNWDTPVDGVRLRAMQSRDVRAPNLGELFAPQTTSNGSAPDPWAKTNVQVILAQLGNPALKPERSINTQLGVVFQPSWFAGFQASVDYYRVAIAGQISTIGAGTSVANCFAGLTQYCAAIITTPGTSPSTIPPRWLQVNSQFFNVASTVTDGFNFETSYQFSLDQWNVVSVPGDFTFRLLGTYVSKFITDPGIVGGIKSNAAGENSGDIPHLKALATQEYSTDKWSLTLTEHWTSEGKLNNNYVVCSPGSCPASSLNNPTINMNSVPGMFYMDLGATYNVGDHVKFYVQIDNLFNKSPPPIYVNDFTSYGVNGGQYDLIGRMFHVGVRVSD
jgi:outer membrane receptor protein involved in Fe transport